MMLFGFLEVEIAELVECLQYANNSIEIGIDRFNKSLESSYTLPIYLLANYLVIVVIQFSPQVRQYRPDDSSLQSSPLPSLPSLQIIKILSVSPIAVDQRHPILYKIDEGTDFKRIVSECDQSGMRIEYRVDEVVDAGPEVLLEDVGLEVLVEMEFVFVIDNALHASMLYYITCILYRLSIPINNQSKQIQSAVIQNYLLPFKHSACMVVGYS